MRRRQHTGNIHFYVLLSLALLIYGQICGGNGGYMSLYYDSSRYFPSNGTIIGTSGKGPALVPTIGNYSYQGCCEFLLDRMYSQKTDEVDLDSANPRPLTDRALQNNAAESIEACAKYCSGYTYFGMEYGQEVSFLSFQRRIDI